MKILVVGTGGVGAAVAAVAQRRSFFERMVFADLDPALPEALVARLDDPRFAAARGEGSQVGSPRAEPHPAEPYSKPGVMLGDLQFAEDERWQEAGLFALVGIGVEPGLSDVFARYASDHLFSEIDEVAVRD